MKNKFRKSYSALILGSIVLALVGCGAGAPPAEEAARPVEFQTPTSATVDNSLSQSSLPSETGEPQVTPTDLPTELIEPTAPLTSTATITDSLAVEIAESTPADLPTELVEPDGTTISPVSPVEEPDMITSTTRGVPLAGSEESLAAAINDLATKLQIAPVNIALISMEAMNWSDASLGCPQEGMMYIQVVTPGYLIILEAAGQQYEYHTDQGTNVVLCEDTSGAAGSRDVAPGEKGQAPLKAAQADLAAKLGLTPQDITLISMEPIDWGDTSLGCPQEGMMYAQVITPGYLIILEAAGQQYEYHTDLATNVVLCDG